MLHLTSWMTTLPMMLIGMVGIILVIGIIVLAVMLLNRLTGRKIKRKRRCSCSKLHRLFCLCKITESGWRP